MNIYLKITAKGPLFEKKIDPIIEKAIIEESLDKIAERTQRGGRGLGSRRNTVSQKRERLVLTLDTTKVRPRTRGVAWQKKNIGIIKAMAPRVVRKTAERIVGAL